jgi:hypothetical protein
MKSLKMAGIAIGAGAILAGGFPAIPAHADPSTSRIDAYMAEFPGGKKLSDNEISYEGGDVRVLMSATRADCGVGEYCVYKDRDYRGAMAKWRASAQRCKKFEFTDYWRDSISSFIARGNCERRNYFLKDKRAGQPDRFDYFEGSDRLARHNDAYDYAAKGL